MVRKRYTPEHIIRLLRQAEVLSSQGKSVSEISWRKEYGGMRIDQAKRLREVERENARLRRAVADLTLDNLILKEAAEGNF
jgi:putative transposase